MSGIIISVQPCMLFFFPPIQKSQSSWKLEFALKYILLIGGEDCYFRLWNIKSGKLIFEDKFVDAVPSTICWRRAESNNCSLVFISALFLFV